MADSGYGLTFIPNQPIIFNHEGDPCRGILDTGYCQKGNRDWVWEFQMGRNPCGSDLQCTEAAPTYGADVVLNGDFASDTIWVKDASWTIAAGLATHTPGSTTPIYQIIGSLVLGITYYLQYEVVGATSGGITPSLGDGAGASQGSQATTNGAHSDMLLNGDTLDPDQITFTPTSDFDGSIDNVVLRAVSYCLAGAGWVFDTTTLEWIHIPGYNVSLDNITIILAVAKWYQVTIQVKDRTAGMVRIITGDNASEWFTDDGVYTRSLYTGTTDIFAIEPDSDFDGKIIITSIFELSEPSMIDLVNPDDLSVVANLIPYSTLDGDRVNVKFSLAQLLQDGAIPGNVVLPVCYRIAVDSICAPIGGDMVTNGQFNGGSGNTITGWTSINGPGMVDYSFSDMIVERIAGDPITAQWRNQTNPDMTAGDYLLIFNITKNDDLDSIAVRFLMDGVTASPWFNTMATGHSYLFTGYVPGLGAAINNQCLIAEYNWNQDGTLVTGQIVVDRVRLFKMASTVQPKYSNCITVMNDSDLTCYKTIEASSYCFNHGFDFRNFTLRMMVPFLKWGALYPLKDNTYIHSDGDNERTYSERDKVWSAKIDRVDEITHDTLSVMLLQDSFIIDGVSYFLKSKQYQPIHDKSARYNLSRAQFDLSTVNSVVFGNKCRDCNSSVTPVDCFDNCQVIVGIFGEEPAASGWYLDETTNILHYYDGAEFTDTMECTGYVLNLDGDAYIKFNEVTGTWQDFIAIVSMVIDTGVVTLTGIIPPGCAAQVMTSIDSGGEWTAATTMHTAQELADGVTFNEPGSGWWAILKVRCGKCEYFSPINTDNE
jgi:hypothetical protein